MTKAQIQRIYKLGGVLGLLKSDELHTLVAGITGKEHVSQLTEDEFAAVEHELMERLKISHLIPPPASKKRSRPAAKTQGGMTHGQINKVWYLMYQLEGCDQTPSRATLGTRLCGIIKRQFRIDASAQQPFRWMTYRQGSQLIEILKGYVSSAEQLAERRGAR